MRSPAQRTPPPWAQTHGGGGGEPQRYLVVQSTATALTEAACPFPARLRTGGQGAGRAGEPVNVQG